MHTRQRGKRIYLDYAATTSVDPRVVRAMQPYFIGDYGNPSSLHWYGQSAIRAVDQSREAIASAIGAEFRECILTGSATEANNLALRGATKAWRAAFPSRRPKILVSAIEHESVLETARDLEKEGCDVVVLPIEKNGVVEGNALEASLDSRTVLVSVMCANNETGVVEPIAEIAKSIAEFRDARVRSFRHEARDNDAHCYPLFHTDAAQAFQFLDCHVDSLGVDLMTLSAHKIYGPKGIGMLYARRPDSGASRIIGNKKNMPETRVRLLDSITTGGGQEFLLRSGTENVPYIVGFRKSMELVMGHKEKEAARLDAFRTYFLKKIKEVYPRAEKNGVPSGKKNREMRELPNILSLYFPDCLAEDMLAACDLLGLAISAGAACATRSSAPSAVLQAMGYSRERARRSIRISFGRPTTKKEVDAAVRIVTIALGKLGASLITSKS